MAITKNAMLRYQVLDKCFSNRYKKYSIKELLYEVNEALIEFNGEESNIKKRQLYDDIRFMESEQGWSIPLLRLKEGRTVYMYYADPEFSIRKQPLNDDEKNKLKTALEVLSRFSGAPQFEWIHETLAILRDKLQLTEEHREVIQLDSNPDLKGIDYLPQLYEAIAQKRVLRISYKNFRADNIEQIDLHPYFLKEYNKRWFLFGLNEQNNIPTWNLALDRIESINYINLAYQYDKTNWNDYFYDLVGVTKPKNKEPQLIEIQLDNNIAPYILTKPLHPSQKTLVDAKNYRITINVIQNLELEALLLSFAPSIEILKPKHLRERILNIYQEAFEKHRN